MPEANIDLDNRYRLMRHEPMLDVNGNPTDKFLNKDRIEYTIEDFIKKYQ